MSDVRFPFEARLLQGAVPLAVLFSGLGGFTREKLIGATPVNALGLGVRALAALAMGALLLIAFRRKVTCRETLDRGVAGALLTVLLTSAICTLTAVDKTVALSRFLERAVALAFCGTMVVGVSSESTDRRRGLAIASAILIGLNIVLFVWGQLASDHLAFQIGRHQHLAGASRFYGTGGNPFFFGVLAVACAGAVQSLPFLRFRGALTAACVLLAATTLSFVTLLLPSFAALSFLRRRWLRRTTVAFNLVAAASLLYLHPLALSHGEKTWTLGRLHPGYTAKGKGDVLMPVKTLTSGSWQFTFHATAYAYLARRAWTCALEHPMGVGMGNFPQSCRVEVMSTYGGWSDQMPAHNEYLERLAEEGILGFSSSLVLLFFLFRRVRTQMLEAGAGAAMAVELMAGLAGATVFRLPMLALIASRGDEKSPHAPPLQDASSAGPRPK